MGFTLKEKVALKKEALKNDGVRNVFKKLTFKERMENLKEFLQRSKPESRIIGVY